MSAIGPLSAGVLPKGVRSRFLDNRNGLSVHILEAGFEAPERPCVLLLHGFPEIAYSWRKIMPALAQAGYHAVAPDLRGYGRTTGGDSDYDGDLPTLAILNLVRDMLGLIASLGRRSVTCVAGHDFGSPVAAYCALARPDVFRSVALLSAPFRGAPTPKPSDAPPEPDVHAALAALSPPRKHYQWYYSTREANGDLWHAPQGVHDFLRAYFHYKSADWKGNRPRKLQAWTADELARMPTYYIMNLHETMPQTVAARMPSPEHIAACRWLTENELLVYGGEFERTGFQGALQWYRCRTTPRYANELALYAGRPIEVPACFIAGAQDWGVRQVPGAFEAMQTTACANLLMCELIDGAGHWVQQEQPEETSRLLLRFLKERR